MSIQFKPGRGDGDTDKDPCLKGAASCKTLKAIGLSPKTSVGENRMSLYIDGIEQSERQRLKFHADLEHEESISPAQIIDAGCVLVERQVAKDLDLSAIFRMDPEQILKALELECVICA